MHQISRLSPGFFLLLLMAIHSNAQNLVPNPSFEIYTVCPNGGGGIGPMLCPPWISIQTADYYNACSTDIFADVPINVQGYQPARTGDAYTGEHFFIGDYREYIQTPLLQTLVADQCYKVGFYLNLGNISCGVNHAGALLTSTAVANPLGMTPQIDWSGGYLSDTVNWVHVFGYFIATGNEAFITIGNFQPSLQTSFDPACNDPFIAYYFIEDVSVEAIPLEMIDVELNGPVTACDSFLIEPEINPDEPDVLYQWSNGTVGPTLTVYTSGVYTVTASYGCNMDVASIEVEITNVPPVEVGDDVTICPGDDYTVSLDPDSGTYEWQDGSNTSDYTITDEGEYSVTLDDGCELTSDTINVTVLQPPEPFSLGADTFICEGENLLLTFDPALGDFMWQNGSSNNSYTIDDDGAYSLTISNMCGEESDEIDVAVISPPFFNIGPASSTLCEGDSIHISLDPDLGNFLWQDGDDNPEYTVHTAGTYSLTVSNACGDESDQMLVDVIIPPLVQFGSDMNLCTGDTITLTGGANTGNYQWQDGSVSTSYEVTVSGEYALSVTNICGIDSDTISVVFNPPVIPPDLGPDLNLCPGQQVTLSVNASGANVLWNDMTTADTLLVDSDGMYTVEVSNNCGMLSDTVFITYSADPPVLNLPADYSLCQGQTDTLDANVSGVTYLWNDMSTGSQLMISSPGMYSLTVSNSCGSDIDTVVVADGGPAPQVILGVDTSICEGTSFLLTPISSNVANWLWQDGSFNSSLAISSPGEYQVTVSNSCGEDYDTIIIGTLPAIPTLSLGEDTSLCPGNSITLSVNIPNVDIVWSDGSISSDFTVTDSASIFATITNSCGSSSDTVEVSLLPEITLLDLGNDQTICPGETIIIDPGIPGVTYLWQDGSSASTMNITQEGLVTLMISNACGSSIDSLLITESTDGPQVDLGPDLVACAGDTVIIPSNISGVNYLWQDGSTNNSFEAIVSGEYYLEVNNLCGSDSDTINVTISGVPPLVDLGVDTMLCEGNSLSLNTTLDSITSATWQDGSTGSNYVVQSAGLYWLTATNRCGEDSDTIAVSFIDAPEPFDLGKDTILCAGESIVLIAPNTAFDFQWQDGSSSPQYLVNSAGIYSLQITNECGTQSDAIQVGIDDVKPLVDLGKDTVWCIGDVIILDATQNVPATYAWNTNATTPSVTVTTPGTYSVTVFTTCFQAADEIQVLADPNCATTNNIFIPNIFSPNEDNFNDVFTVYPDEGIEVLSIKGSIFDRWGDLVFSSTSTSFVWDGKFGDKEMMPGVYVYSLTIQYKVNGREVRDVLVGDVTVVR